MYNADNGVKFGGFEVEVLFCFRQVYDKAGLDAVEHAPFPKFSERLTDWLSRLPKNTQAYSHSNNNVCSFDPRTPTVGGGRDPPPAVSGML